MENYLFPFMLTRQRWSAEAANPLKCRVTSPSLSPSFLLNSVTELHKVPEHVRPWGFHKPSHTGLKSAKWLDRLDKNMIKCNLINFVWHCTVHHNTIIKSISSHNPDINVLSSRLSMLNRSNAKLVPQCCLASFHVMGVGPWDMYLSGDCGWSMRPSPVRARGSGQDWTGDEKKKQEHKNVFIFGWPYEELFGSISTRTEPCCYILIPECRHFLARRRSGFDKPNNSHLGMARNHCRILHTLRHCTSLFWPSQSWGGKWCRCSRPSRRSSRSTEQGEELKVTQSSLCVFLSFTSFFFSLTC